MTINWFPGHMHKARKEMAEMMGEVDLVIEVLDARIPYSSENPFAATLRGDRPLIKLLNKCDLADPQLLQEWKDYLEEESGVRVLMISAIDDKTCSDIVSTCHRLVKGRSERREDIRALITGIPNVGKSTVINALAQRVIAKARNEPGVTKEQQRVVLKNGVVLIDTPGILWPRFDNQRSGYRLAVTGAIKQTVIDFEDIAVFAADYMGAAYPEAVKERFKQETLPDNGHDVLVAIAKHRGMIRAKGKIDFNRACEVFLNELRGGKIGRYCLETPEMAKIEKVETAAELVERAAKKEARKKKKKADWKRDKKRED